MQRDQINAFCRALPATTHVVQWGGSDVWKVGGKVFAIVSAEGVSFKTSELMFEVLGHEEGIRPAPYLASRGFKWLQHYGPPGGLPDAELGQALETSYEMIRDALPRKTRAELGV
ncbi:MmcQ/YjbR family DNA-binding protein [Pseudorhodobacter turbinis]|uniref:MmcQ/YjbR family DNA-binding protein n=1 Tax=Pseudorhodobacter turbinis TaxID=2500533 RepID=A0A4V1E0M2_9RHOB|nr:MmcQ/YjbR family DNA-binding protein [Pseudorhodobacter turbinis]QCO55124.1 MmcQ/YjbR family DNA-binding protein [Pseudorhodobacter turbinis]